MLWRFILWLDIDRDLGLWEETTLPQLTPCNSRPLSLNSELHKHRFTNEMQQMKKHKLGENELEKSRWCHGWSIFYSCHLNKLPHWWIRNRSSLNPPITPRMHRWSYCRYVKNRCSKSSASSSIIITTTNTTRAALGGERILIQSIYLHPLTASLSLQLPRRRTLSI